MTEADPHDLARFVAAQDDVWPAPRDEIARGRKASHWMWFVFPQIAGLGQSAMAWRYAIHGLGEARAYLADAVLDGRLRECLAALVALPVEATAESVFGGIDAVKLRSSLTLFAAAGGGPAFDAALDRWFGGVRDAATLARLG